MKMPINANVLHRLVGHTLMLQLINMLCIAVQIEKRSALIQLHIRQCTYIFIQSVKHIF